jgi:hypothetical protein
MARAVADARWLLRPWAALGAEQVCEVLVLASVSVQARQAETTDAGVMLKETIDENLLHE